jgi:hypothetical protein
MKRTKCDAMTRKKRGLQKAGAARREVAEVKERSLFTPV